MDGSQRQNRELQDISSGALISEELLENPYFRILGIFLFFFIGLPLFSIEIAYPDYVSSEEQLKEGLLLKFPSRL